MIAAEPSARSPRALIVDDDDDTRLLLVSLLQGRGYRTTDCATGREALASFESRRPQVVLLDYRMPDLSGLEVLRRLIELDPHVPVLIVTGQGDETAAAALMKSGAFEYLTKPFDPDRLAAAVSDALSHRRKALRERRLEIVRLERLYQQMFDMAGDGILKIDLEGRVLLANRMAGTILGEERLKGKLLPELLAPSSRGAWYPLAASLAGNRVAREDIQVEVLGPEGPRTLEIRAVPLREQGAVKGMEVILTDITAHLQQDRALRKLEERAIVAGLSRHLSHVLLNSLTVAGGRLRKLLEAGSGDQRTGGPLRVIGTELARMEEVVRGYQDYVNVMNLSAVSLCRLEDFLREFRELLAGRRDPDLERVLEPVRPLLDWREVPTDPGDAVVLIDPPFLRLGLAYLVRGAAAFALRSGSQRVALTMHGAVQGRSAVISVFTPGVRVPPEQFAGMYSPWEHQMLQQTFEDWGITIANGIAERHQGALDISTGAEGTRYDLRLPALPGTDQAAPAPPGPA